MAQLIAAAQTLTGTFADLGAEIDMSQYTRCLVWLNIDINDSLNVRLRVLGKLAPRGTLEYQLPIESIVTTTPFNVSTEGEYFEFNVDADQQIVIEFVTNGSIPYLQFQVMAGTVGAGAGQIDNADITFSSY